MKTSATWIHVLLLLAGMAFAQISKAQISIPLSPSGVLDTVFDSRGYKYILSDIRVDTTSQPNPLSRTTQLCSAGYFDLYFETGSGMEGSSTAEVDRRNVICQVFSDISAFIGSPLNSTGNKVKIWVRDITHVPGSSAGSLGLALSYYNIAPSASGGIADNEIWKTIHSGYDSYTNVSSPLITTGNAGLYYHGMVAFNFNQPFNTNLSFSVAPVGEYDLYSVALHEVTHALGFHTLLNYNGISQLGTAYNYFSRYDQYLKKGSTPLITNSGACSLYNYQFNSALSNTVIAPGCTITPAPTTTVSTDNTACTVAITYSGSVNVPVYTPTCYEPGSSLSHFEDQCFPIGSPVGNNAYFVMSNANGTGAAFTKRYLKPEERAVLCDIGYSVTTTFGNSGNNTYYNYGGSACPGLNVSGINDGITSGGSYAYMGSSGSAINITSILLNDINADAFECLEDVTGTSTLSATSGVATATISFTSNVGGVHLLRYIPYSISSGIRGNITYIYVYVQGGSCTPSACNMINNGGFENMTACGQFDYATSTPSVNTTVDCWSTLMYTPDAFQRGCTNTNYGANSIMTIPTPYSSPSSDSWSGSPNNDFIGMGSISNNHICEAVQSLLNAPIIQNEAYTISFKAKVANNHLSTGVTSQVLFGGSPSLMVPFFPFLTSLPAAITELTRFTIINDNAWHSYTQTFTYTASASLNNLVLMNSTNMNYLSGQPDSYVYVDDVSLLPVSQSVNFDLPNNALCLTDNIPDLSVYLSPGTSGGVFSGAGVGLTGGGTYSLNATTAGAGLHTISYTFTNNIDCQVIVSDNILVVNPSSITITASTIPSIVCTGNTATLTANGATSYTWQPGGLTGITVTVSPSSTTVYTITGSVCSSTAQASHTVVVNPAPVIVVTANASSICPGQSPSLTGWGALTYTWQPGNLTGTTVIVTPTVSTVYTVTGTNSCGVTSSTTKSITIMVPPTLTVTATSSVICSGQTTTITATATPSLNYSWSSNSGVWSPVTPVSPTTTTVYSVIGFAGGYCNAAAQYTITVSPNPTVSVNSPTICIGTSTVLTASGANTYTWNTGATTNSITVTPTVTTIYTVTGSNSFGCQSVKIVTVTVKPFTSITSSGTLCAGQSKTLTATGATTYTWSTGSNTSSIVVTPTITTNYTVSGTGGGCSGSVVITVTVIPNPVLSVSASPTIVCLSTSTLTASGATTYSWNTGPTTSTIAVTPTVTTIYTVTGTASGCSSTTTLSVTYGATAPIVSVSSNTPAGCGGSTTLTASGGASYTWSPGGATTSTIAVTTSVVTVYTVTSTFGGSCGTGTTAVVINPNTSTLCCSSSNTTMGTSLTSTVSIAGTYSGTVIDVKGTLLSTGSVTFTGCTLRMSKGARIVMSPDHDLTLTNCKLFSCSELWDGIYFQTFLGKIGNITVSSSTIEDMYNGIVMDYADYNVPSTPVCGNVTIDQSILNKNYISIQMKNSSGVTAASAYGLALTSSTISSNTSTTSPGSTLKPSSTYTYAYNTWTGGATSSTNTPFVNFPRSYVGIYLYDLRDQDPVIVGDSTNSAKTNTFDNLDFGIVDMESVVKVHNNYFKNITGSLKQTADGETWPAAGPDEIGIAVFAKHPVNLATYTLTVGTYTALPSSNSQYPKGNQFEDCNKCVSATSCKNVFVKGNVITAASTNTVPVFGVDAYYYYKGQNGIWVSDLYDRETLDYNSISNISTGIYSSHTLGSSTPTLSISHNEIKAPASNGFCKQAIQLAQVGGSNLNTGLLTVFSNTTSEVYNGILSTNVPNGVNIYNNTVSVAATTKTVGSTSTSTRTAVSLTGSHYAYVKGNTLTSNVSSVPTSTPGANYLVGLKVTGSTFLKVHCNLATNLGRDFAFQGSCTNSEFLANNMQSSYRGLEMYLNAVIGNQGAPSGTPNLSANTWTTLTQHTFVQAVSGANNVNTASKFYLLAGGATQPTINVAVTSGQEFQTAAGSAINLTSGTSYTCNSGTAQRMANSAGGRNITTTTGGNNQRSMATDADSLTEYEAMVTNGEEDYEAFPAEFIYTNRQLVYKLMAQDSINPPEGNILNDFYEATRNTAIDKLTQVQFAIADNDVEAANALNSLVPVSNTVEQKHQRANELELEYLGDRQYIYSASERAELTDMANECASKGVYVLQARGILDVITGKRNDYTDNCETEGNSRKAKVTDPATQTSFNLFPNPNNGSMQLDYDLASYANATMDLYDVTGKLIKSYKLENTKGTLRINEQTLHNGVYFYRILVGNNIIKNDKIVVIK